MKIIFHIISIDTADVIYQNAINCELIKNKTPVIYSDQASLSLFEITCI